MLFRKMLRDIKLNKTQFISIFLMALLGVFIYSGISSEWNGLQKVADEFYEETNMVNVWVYSSGFSENAAEEVENINGIKGVERRLTLQSIADFDKVPIRTNYGYGILSYQAFPEGIPITYTDLLIITEEKANAKLENSIDQALDGKYSVYVTRENMRSYMQFNEEMKEHKAMGQIFPIVFLSVAVLTIVTTMARLVNNQRTQIGILKAVGFKRRRILFHYVSYGLWISLAGAIIGAILGPFTLPYLFYEPMQTAYTLPQWKSSIPISVLYMAAVAVLSCTMATLLTCSNVLKDTPSQCLRPKAPKTVKHSIFDRLKLWSRLSFNLQWNLRDVFRCKGRSSMAIAGVLGCSALLICALGLQDTMDYIVEWNYKVINQYETQIELENNITSDELDKVIEATDGESIFEGKVELKAKESKKSGVLMVMDEVSLIQFVDSKRNIIQLPKDQVSISYKMAENLSLAIGDEVSWHIYGEEKWHTSQIGTIYRTPFAQGITMHKSYFEDYGYTYLPTAIVTADANVLDQVSEEVGGVSKILNKDELIESYETLAEAMDMMVYTLMVAAVILAIVVIYNLGVLSFTERQRELSTLKVIGFKTQRLRILLLTQNIWLTVIGIIPGIPIGIFILHYIFKFIGEVFDFIIIINFSSYIYCILGTLLLSILVNRMFSKRVKNIDMVSSLKGVE